MLDLRRRSGKLDVGFPKGRINIRLATRDDRADCLSYRGAIRDRLKFHRPVEVVVEGNNAKTIRILQQSQRRFCRFLGHLDFLAAHTAGFIEHHDHGHRVRLFLLGLERDGQNLLDRGLRVSAFAVIVLASGQNEAAAEIPDIRRQGFHLLVAKVVPSHVAQHDCIVCIQLFDGRGNCAWGDRLHIQAFVGKRGLEISGALRMTFDVENLRASLDHDRRPEFVVIRKRIACGLHFSLQGHRPVVFDARIECNAIQPANELNLARTQYLFAIPQLDFGRCIGLAVDVGLDRE